MPYGYCGKLLEIDLSTKKYKEIDLSEEDFKKYLGGSGIGAKILYDNYDHKLPALSPQSPLMFMVGLLIGLPAPSAAKMTVIGKSPLTGIWGESIVGGFLGPEIKKAGYDGIIFIGKSDTPVSVYIKDDQVQFMDASELWGRDVYETDKILKEQTDPKAQTACIGPAGEKLIAISSIMTGGVETRAAGRGGYGALMGSKNLKALVIRGTKQVPIHDRENFIKLTREFNNVLKTNAKILYDYGTLGTIQGVESEGDLPVKNWTLGSWEDGAAKISGQALDDIVTSHYACYACSIRCGKMSEVRVGPNKGTISRGPEYETGASFGSNILNDDLDYICAVNDLCNKYGIDTIEGGNVVALAIECFENGLLTLEDTGGLELRWGMTEGLIPLVEKICFREKGIGELLGKGVRDAAEEIGGMAKEFAIETKGLSYAMHDPRAYTTMVSTYAVGNKGASHLESLGYFSEGGAYPASCMGFTKKTEPHGHEDKAEYAALLQDLMNLFDALGMCKFIMLGQITHEHMRDWINYATGWDLTTDDVKTIGERLFNLKRMYNVRLGISRKDDTIPPRLMMHAKETGAAAGVLPHYPRIMNDYYKHRGWDEEGIPTQQKLAQLNLLDVIG